MGFGSSPILVLVLFSSSLFPSATSDDASDKLLQGINSYRASLKLPVMTENKNAACLADQVADQFKDQPCTNTTGSNTIPGTEQQFPNFPDFLDHCHLNATVTRDGMILPACVPGLESSLVLSNFTKSQYSGSLNDSSFVGAGIGSQGNWIVVVLSTDTPTGNYATVAGASSILITSIWSTLLILLVSFLVVFTN